MASHASKVRLDIDRWVAAGLIDRATGDVLYRDVQDNERRGFSFGSILAILAALLFGAAILIFVASNWEAIPRIVRVLALFGVILAGYVGGAALKLSDHGTIGEAVWLVAAAAFGGAIAMIGQMYHLSGDETEALLVWCIGTGVAAAGLRSGVLTMAAVGIASAWLFLRGVDFWRVTEFPHLFLALAAALWAISLWTRSTAARHLILLSLVFYAVLAAVEYDVTTVALVMLGVSAVLFLAAALAPEPVDRVVPLDGLLPAHALFGFLTGIVMLQLDIWDDAGPAFILAASVGLAATIGAVLLAGRDSRGLRWIAYLGFAVELCLIYGVKVGTMLGTSGFFLAAGALLGVLSIAIIRIEKRMRPLPATVGAAA